MLDKKIIDFDGLSIYHEKINEVFKTKQDVISDLDDIRSGAELGSTALQDIPDRSITFDKLDQDVLDELYGGTGGTGTYPEINHGTSDTTFTLTPNTLHVWDEVDSLTLTLGEKTTGVANEYLFQFTSGSEPTVLTLPDSIIWANNEILEIESNRIYQISILNNISTFITAEYEIEKQINALTVTIYPEMSTFAMTEPGGPGGDDEVTTYYAELAFDFSVASEINVYLKFGNTTMETVVFNPGDDIIVKGPSFMYSNVNKAVLSVNSDDKYDYIVKEIIIL